MADGRKSACNSIGNIFLELKFAKPASLQIGRKITIAFTEKESSLRSGDPFSPSSLGSKGKRMLPEMTGNSRKLFMLRD